MSKYHKLTSHLASFKGDRCEANFRELEEIIGFPLPRSAHSYPAWWSNQQVEGHSQSASWQSIGWKTAEVDLARKRVVFVRQGNSRQTDASAFQGREAQGLSIAQAKLRLSEFYGIPEENIEITIRG